MILITGGSGSGKSAFAEEYLLCLSAQAETKYYIATMQPFGEESLAKIRRHQRLRAGKGFTTLEQPRDLTGAAGRIAALSGRFPEKDAAFRKQGFEASAVGDTALLECMSNLVANEMFAENGIRPGEQVTEEILAGVRKLNQSLAHLVIVTNNVFEDGISYEETTMEYIEAMGQVNERLAGMADTVIEVAAGIPVVWKGTLL